MRFRISVELILAQEKKKNEKHQFRKQLNGDFQRNEEKKIYFSLKWDGSQHFDERDSISALMNDDLFT